MLDPTEGVPHSRVGKSFLRRNLAKNFDVDTILSDDRQELRIDVNTYRIIFIYNGVPGKPFVYEKKMSKNEMASAEEAFKKALVKRDEKMREKFVINTPWMKDLSADQVELRKSAWQQGLEEGLWKMEENLNKVLTNAETAGDAMVVDGAI